jgi:hypothetical protein
MHDREDLFEFWNKYQGIFARNQSSGHQHTAKIRPTFTFAARHSSAASAARFALTGQTLPELKNL